MTVTTDAHADADQRLEARATIDEQVLVPLDGVPLE